MNINGLPQNPVFQTVGLNSANFDPTAAVQLGSQNSLVTPGQSNFLLGGIANSGNFTGIGNVILGYANTVNLSGDTSGPSTNLIVGVSNTFTASGSTAGQVKDNSVFGNTNVFTVTSGFNIASNLVVGTNNTFDASTGSNVTLSIIVGRQNFARVAQGTASKLIELGMTNVYDGVSGGSTLAIMVGANNTVNCGSGNNLTNNSVYGFNNTLNARKCNNSFKENIIFGHNCLLSGDFLGANITGNVIVGNSSNIIIQTGGSTNVNNFVGGNQNTLVVVGTNNSFNNLIGSNNQASGNAFNTLVGHGLSSTRATGVATFGIGTSFIQINSGVGSVAFQGLNPRYPAYNVTGNFTLTGGQFRYVWTGIATWTGTLPSPSTYSGMDFLVKNISSTASLALSGNVDYGVNYTMTPLQGVRLWSDNNSWLLI